MTNKQERSWDRIDLFNLKALRKEGRFGEYLIIIWGIVESSMDLAIENEFHLRWDDDRLEYLKQNTFETKRQFLKRRKVLGEEQDRIIRRFQKDRNQLFHGKLAFLYNKQRSDSDLHQILDEANSAFQSCMEIVEPILLNSSKIAKDA